LPPEEDVPEVAEEIHRAERRAREDLAGHHDAKPGPEDADQWKDVKDKLKHLER